MLEDCKTNCDVLIIGLHDDPTLDEEYRIKTGGKNKNIPVQTYEERLIQISGVKHVDHVAKYTTEAELMELLQLINPDVRFIGEDWRGKEFTGHELDIEIHFNPRSHTYSTSGLRRRVYEAEKAKLE
jgi:glycerol-3-phosphate cytidylyltransferase